MPPAPDADTIDVLRAAGAAGETLDALLAYTANPFDVDRLDLASLPLADEPHLADWEDYERDAIREGVVRALGRRLVQFRFPIAAGISQSDAYRAATKRGILPPGDAPGLRFDDPDGLSLALHPTLAGRVPVIACRERSDFVRLVRALSCRNEPEPVPDAMGACIVSGLNNWDRVARARHRLESERGAPFDEVSWGAAFRAVAADKPSYQDRLLILSGEPYSAVPASAVGETADAWRERSVDIRREHESTHYFTLRALGVMRNNLLDEMIADFAGLAAAYGRYDPQLALRFLGLESYPDYRAGGRFENYLQHPPLPAGAVVILRGLVVDAAAAIGRASERFDLRQARERALFVIALAGFSLPQLAGPGGAVRLVSRVARVTTAGRSRVLDAL